MKKENIMEEKKNKKNVEGEGANFEPRDLAYNEEDASYELDVNDKDPDWDHPANYDTLSEGAENDDSTYDSSNPYVGDEYADLDELREDNLEDNNMRITDASNLRISKKDEELAKDEEDYRDDLDAEGYPKNDKE